MPFLERDGDVFVLYLGNEGQTDSENRFHPDWIDEIHAKLDEVEAADGPAALVTTASGKFFSNGLDTDYIFGNFDKLHGYLDRVHTVFTRLLTFPMTTVAAVNGHAFGAGAMVASSHDFRVMRSDRGFYCLPEVNLNMPFSIGMSSLLQHRLGTQVALTAMTTGRRYGAADALTAGIVDATAESEALVSTAVELARQTVGNRGPNLGGIKKGLHSSVLDALVIPTDAANLAFGPQ